MIDIVKEWLDKGLKEKVIGFVVLYWIVYGIIWGLMEPISTAGFLPAGFMQTWWIYQIIFGFIITPVVFIRLLPGRELQTFGFELSDTKLDSCFQVTAGRPFVQVSTDGYHGDVLTVSGNFYNDELDAPIKPAAQCGRKIIYRYLPDSYERFYLHLRLELLSGNGSKPQMVWLTLRTDISEPTGTIGQKEMAYPVKGRPTKNGWLVSGVDIPTAVRNTFGKEGWQYNKIAGLRVRGKVKIQKIIIR